MLFLCSAETELHFGMYGLSECIFFLFTFILYVRNTFTKFLKQLIYFKILTLLKEKISFVIPLDKIY